MGVNMNLAYTSWTVPWLCANCGDQAELFQQGQRFCVQCLTCDMTTGMRITAGEACEVWAMRPGMKRSGENGRGPDVLADLKAASEVFPAATKQYEIVSSMVKR